MVINQMAEYPYFNEVQLYPLNTLSLISTIHKPEYRHKVIKTFIRTDLVQRHFDCRPFLCPGELIPYLSAVHCTDLDTPLQPGSNLGGGGVCKPGSNLVQCVCGGNMMLELACFESVASVKASGL